MKKFIALALVTSIFVAIFFYRNEVDKQIQKYTGYSPLKYLVMKYVLLTDKDFVQGVNDLAEMWGKPANWLIGCMYIESSLDASAVNKFTGASGLIQFMPSTALELGTTVEAIRAMSATEQLSYVESYLEKYSSKWNEFIDVYLSIFYPAAIGKGDDYVIGIAKGEEMAHKISKVNPAYDIDKDGKITIAEIKEVVMKHLLNAGLEI